MKVGGNLSFTVKASDADGDHLTYSTSGLPTGATLNNTSGFFSWAPKAGQEGVYNITFKVSDGKFYDSETVNISVTKENLFIISGKMYDNRLHEVSPEVVFSNKSFLDVGGISGSGIYRDIIWFNVSEYTNSNEISSSTLSLCWYYPASSRPNDTIIEVYRPAFVWNPIM